MHLELPATRALRAPTSAGLYSAARVSHPEHGLQEFGGSGVVNVGTIIAEDTPWNAVRFVSLRVPPLGAVAGACLAGALTPVNRRPE